MNYRDVTFELSEPPALELEVQWSYSCNSWDEEESEVIPPSDLAAQVKAHAERMIPIWIKEIESQCMDMELWDTPAEWAKEDAEAYADAQAEADFERNREEEYYKMAA